MVVERKGGAAPAAPPMLTATVNVRSDWRFGHTALQG